MRKTFFFLIINASLLNNCTSKHDSSDQIGTESATGTDLSKSCQGKTEDPDWGIMTKCDSSSSGSPITCNIQSLFSTGVNECIARSDLRSKVLAKRANCLSYKDVVCKISSSPTSNQSCASDDPRWNALALCERTVDGAPVTCSIQDLSSTSVNECIAKTELKALVVNQKAKCLPRYEDIVCIKNNDRICVNKTLDPNWRLTQCSSTADSSPSTCSIENFTATAANECMARNALRSILLEKQQAACLSYKNITCTNSRN